jgi:hypothetical protein
VSLDQTEGSTQQCHTQPIYIKQPHRVTAHLIAVVKVEDLVN